MFTQNNLSPLAQIEFLYSVYGQHHYEEKCTQLQHAEQCGSIAMQLGLGEEFALAAFLHDVGHFVAEDRKLAEQSAYGYAAHDQLGADFLAACGFSQKIVNLVRQHVQVKRYLAAIEPGYLSGLSAASTVTLAQQGGPMSDSEIATYASIPDLTQIIQLRKIDDGGKVSEMACLPLAYWLELAAQHLQRGAQTEPA